jgi:hypothetical protein
MRKIFLTAALAAMVLSLSAGTASAQDTRAYKEGPVLQLTYVRTKDGHFEDYMKFLDGQYKSLMEANKKAGLIMDYKVYAAQPRSANEPDLVLSVTYANMGALDRVEEAIAVAEKQVGSLDKQEKEAAGRGVIRDILGGEVVRELILK